LQDAEAFHRRIQLVLRLAVGLLSRLGGVGDNPIDVDQESPAQTPPAFV